jgi:hypothetical protein
MERDGRVVVRLRFTRPYGPHARGAIAEVEEELAERLIAWDYAVRERQQTLIETAAAEVEVERADMTPRRRRR